MRYALINAIRKVLWENRNTVKTDIEYVARRFDKFIPSMICGDEVLPKEEGVYPCFLNKQEEVCYLYYKHNFWYRSKSDAMKKCNPLLYPNGVKWWIPKDEMKKLLVELFEEE